MQFKRISLSKEFLSSLEGFLSETLMYNHYNGNHKIYEDSLNKLIANYQKNNPINSIKITSLENLITHYYDFPVDMQDKVQFFAGGLYNHNFFFSILSKESYLDNNYKIFEKIVNDFGSWNNLKTKLIDSMKQLLGVGWVWLVYNKNDKRLEIKNTYLQNSPLTFNWLPVIGIDMWEHAYLYDYNYKNYEQPKVEYINNLFKILNWRKIEDYYLSYIK